MHHSHHSYDIVAPLIFAIPRVNEMEHRVRFDIEPLNTFGVCVTTRDNTVAGFGVLVVIENELVVFYGVFWIEFHWQIWDNYKVLRDLEIVDHPAARYFNIVVSEQLSFSAHDGDLNEGLAWHITKHEEFTCYFINSRVGTTSLL